MAMIHVNRGATSLGAFPEEQVREGIRAGRFLPSDLGWREGMASWQPLSQFSEFAEDVAAAAERGFYCDETGRRGRRAALLRRYRRHFRRRFCLCLQFRVSEFRLISD